MKTIYNTQKILTGKETIYIGEPNINKTLSSGTHIFVACAGKIIINSANVKVYTELSPTLKINNTVGAKTYREKYAVGDIFISTNAESPAIRFGGTWEPLTDDAYLKIVTAGAGNTDGTAPSHRIPIECVPSHTHDIYNMQRTSSIFLDGRDNFVWRAEVGGSNTTSSTGGNTPYHPWYYGIYAWRRTE